MKKTLAVTILLLTILANLGCSNADKIKNTSPNSKPATMQDSSNKPKKALVVYYSRSGNTKELAYLIHQKVPSDIVEIKTVKPYPKDYSETTKQAKEELESGFKPEIQPLQINLNKYNTIFIGSPCWWSNIATPVISFLSQNDLSGKTVIPFMTYGGGNIGTSVSTIKRLCPNSTVKEVLSLRGTNVKSSQDDIALWLQKLDLNK